MSPFLLVICGIFKGIFIGIFVVALMLALHNNESIIFFLDSILFYCKIFYELKEDLD